MTATKATHTPGPWRCKVIYGDVHKHAVLGEPHADGGDRAPICRCADAANAELIVRAVNAHDALLEACKAALPHLSCKVGRHIVNECPRCIIEAAIALAEGRNQPTDGATPR